MRFGNHFTVPIPVEEAWALLLDVPRIAPCLPGARLTETLGDGRYKGEAALKVGPVQLLFGGEASLSAVDPATRTARVAAKGADRKGRGNATAAVAFACVPHGAATRVEIDTDLTLTGTVAQYGRASGLIQEIASQLIAQFAANLETLIRDSAPAACHPAAAPAIAADLSHAASPRPEPGAPVSAVGLLVSALGAMARRWLARVFGR